MSYRLESLLDCLNSTSPEDQGWRVLSIFAHLSMDVPRSWWERSLNQANLREDHVRLLKDLFSELENYPTLSGRINYSLLVAMAFLDDEEKPSFGSVYSHHSLDEYITGAESVLAQRPDVRCLGEMVTKMAESLKRN